MQNLSCLRVYVSFIAIVFTCGVCPVNVALANAAMLLADNHRAGPLICDGSDEDIAQQQYESVSPPPLPNEFTPHEFTLPEGFRSQLVAGPPLVTHPTMGCFDDRGRLFICDGAGVNMTAEELEENLPNNIKMLEDLDGDGVFDKSTIFADSMTFPMGGAWHDGALYVASPPNIWRLQDTTGDGKADKRDIIVGQFGYTGNAASIHGCFFSPDGRLYWCDGYHGHEFKDKDGNVTSKRKGSYIFSCWPDGSDVRIHCGGGMDNPVEVDFTETGDVIGTVNIMYTRPRIDCLVHWQYGGAYPHREAVLDELKVTGDLLGPIHKFGHVAISGTTRYRSGMMDQRWDGNFFATEFNIGKVVRVELSPSGSTYSAVEREFLSCGNRDFHPTDVIEDADGSLLVVDTGGWFYRGCPTSQIARPDVKGGIYRIWRDGMANGMANVADSRGLQTDWTKRTDTELMGDLQDSRFAVRERVINECVRRGNSIVEQLAVTAKSADIVARQNALWAACRIATANRHRGQPANSCLQIISDSLSDSDASIRQIAWRCIHSLAFSLTEDGGVRGEMLAESDLALLAFHKLGNVHGDRLLQFETSAAVRRTAYHAIGRLKLLPQEQRTAASRGSIGGLSMSRVLTDFPAFADREEEHAVLYAMIQNANSGGVATLLLRRPDLVTANMIIAADQSLADGLSLDVLETLIVSDREDLAKAASTVLIRTANRVRATSDDTFAKLSAVMSTNLPHILKLDNSTETVGSLLSTFGSSPEFSASAVAAISQQTLTPAEVRRIAAAIASSSKPVDGKWQQIVFPLLQNSQPNHLLVFESAGNINSDELRKLLQTQANDESATTEQRLGPLKGLLKTQRNLTPEQFSFLLTTIQTGQPAERLLAVNLVVAANLTAEQLDAVATLLIPNAAGPQLVELVSLFNRSLKLETAVAFLEGIENARAFNSLPRLDLSEVVKRFPPELHDRANALLDRMYQAEQQQLLKLDAVVGLLNSADAVRGKEVFFSIKSRCATCHMVGTEGKRVGPDLTTIGANRAPKDLLESILFPSATIVRQYEPYTVVTADGRTFSGLIIKDNANEMTLQQSSGDPVTVRKADVDELVPATVSIMPQGLDEALSAQQIADMVAWLQTLR